MSQVNFDYLFDPPQERHSDGTVIPLECQCEECHEAHRSDIAKNYGHPDFKCCTEEINERIADGTWCPVKKLEHGDIYMDGEVVNGKFQYKKPGLCLECAHERICQLQSHEKCA